MADQTKSLAAETLRAYTAELFAKGGMSEEDAGCFADELIQTSLWGIDSHGVLRVPVYFERILHRGINPAPKMTYEQIAPALTLIDADEAAGCIAAGKAMERAVENARKTGIGAAGVRNSNHYGAAALYAKIAADAGMIGIALTNVPALVTAPGAKRGVVGNNPISIGVPTFCEFPFLLDTSLSAIAEGKLRLALAKGESIPLGVGVDQEGRDTDDPARALEGFLLPIGGIKGLGLAYAVDILSGVITGGAFADMVHSSYNCPDVPSRTCHLMIAIDQSPFIRKEDMQKRMRQYHDYIRGVPLVDGASPLCFPGEIEHQIEQERRKTGIPVPLITLEQMRKLGVQYGVKTVLS